MPIVGDLLDGRYRIVAALGAGGMATVWRAIDERLGREVAVKILSSNLARDASTAQQFEAEARTLATINHASIVAVYDVAHGDPETGREPYYVMELCAGGSLADLLAGDRPISADDLVPIVVTLADGLTVLHDRGVIHRDVKPHNILLTAQGPKLADFGLARETDLDDASTAVDAAPQMGTWAYLAPEILAGEPAGVASDVYALGTVAFQGLTGRLPRQAASIAELVTTRATAVPLPSVIAPALGEAFDEPLREALAADPRSRPSATALGAALIGALGRWHRQTPPTPATAPGILPAEVVDLDAPTVAIPTASLAAAAESDAQGQNPRATDSGGRPPMPLLAAGALAVVVLAGLWLATAARPATAPGASPTPPSALAQASSSPSPSPLPSPSTPSPSPSASPSPAGADLTAARDALDRVRSAIEQARGGKDGLKGKTANELSQMASDVAAALDRQDLFDARAAAAKLDDRVQHLGGEREERRFDDLRAAVRQLVEAIPD